MRLATKSTAGKPSHFGRLLHEVRGPIPMMELARRAGVNHGHISRIEHGERDAPHVALIDAFASALHLTRAEHDRLLLAAGYAPLSLRLLGWDDALDELAQALADPRLAGAEKEELRFIIKSICEAWRKA